MRTIKLTDNEFLDALIEELTIKARELEKRVERRETDIGVVSIEWDMYTGEMDGRRKAYQYIAQRLRKIIKESRRPSTLSKVL